MSKTAAPTDDDVKQARRLAEELRRRLPKQFVVKSKVVVNGKPRFRDVVLRADPKIPGCFTGRVDITPPNGKNIDSSAESR